MFSIFVKFIFLTLILYWNASPVSCEPTENDDSIFSSCTNDTFGLPQCVALVTNSSIINSCDFIPHNRVLPTGLKWMDGSQRKNEEMKVSGLEIREPWQSQEPGYRYKYVDTSDESIFVGSRTRLSGTVLDPKVKAVCITFWYVTNSDGGDAPAIHVMNRKSTVYSSGKGDYSETVGFIGSVKNSTLGEWRQATFHACLWTQSEIVIEIEKTSNVSGVAAIGDITVTQSTLLCNCLKRYHGLPACHFNKNWCTSYKNGTSDDTLAWNRGTHLKSQRDGYYTINGDVPWKEGIPPGFFAFLDVGDDDAEVGSKSTLLGGIYSSKASQVCITFNYATTGNKAQTLRIYNKFTNSYKSRQDHNEVINKQFLGQITDKTEGTWREVTFVSQIVNKGSYTKSYIAFEGEKIDKYSYFALDNVGISERVMYLPTTTTAATTTTRPINTITTSAEKQTETITVPPSPPATATTTTTTISSTTPTANAAGATKATATNTKTTTATTITGKSVAPAISPQRTACRSYPSILHVCPPGKESNSCCVDSQSSATKIKGYSIGWRCQKLMLQHPDEIIE